MGSCPNKVQLLFLSLPKVSPPTWRQGKVVQWEKGTEKDVPLWQRALDWPTCSTAAWGLPLIRKSQISPLLNHL